MITFNRVHPHAIQSREQHGISIEGILTPSSRRGVASGACPHLPALAGRGGPEAKTSRCQLRGKHCNPPSLYPYVDLKCHPLHADRCRHRRHQCGDHIRDSSSEVPSEWFNSTRAKSSSVEIKIDNGTKIQVQCGTKIKIKKTTEIRLESGIRIEICLNQDWIRNQKRDLESETRVRRMGIVSRIGIRIEQGMAVGVMSESVIDRFTKQKNSFYVYAGGAAGGR
ncbi:hypothetical protein EVAR_101767_1 [Eumeta japonica]|uniref:Uncharacterized protein n=1 Tax=Eumeta variegata TaxID=151549 RepID=A0A4C1SQP1_EUMVA|nr:hypothetical protein EVAR_101767_1 [Eumeta japonica]